MRRLATLFAICAIWLCRVSAQTNDPAPALSICVTNCIFEFIPASGCGTDAACLCHSDVYKNAVQKCLQSNCPAKEALLAGRYQSTACGEPVRSEDTTTPRVVWIMFATAAIGVVARLIFRNPYAGGHGYGADDWTMLLALIILIPFNAVVHLMAEAGTGRDIWSLEPEDITKLLHTFWMEGIVYAILMTIIKVSILLLYLRIWTAGSTENITFRRVCFILIGINIVGGIAVALSVVFECMPISYAWTRWDGEHQGTCIDYSAQSYAMSAISGILDLATFMLPTGKLANLPLSKGKKFGVCFVFALGLLATAASIVRLAYLIRDSSSPNFSLWLAPVAIWTSLECNLAVICACLPGMAGLIQKVWNHTCKGKNWSSRRGSTNIDNVRISSLQTPAQYYDEDSRSLPSMSIRYERGGLTTEAIGRTQTKSSSTTTLSKWHNRSHPTSKPLPRNKPLPSVSTAPDRALMRWKHKIMRHHRKWVGEKCIDEDASFYCRS